MIGLTVVEWGKPGGGSGFLPYEDPNRERAGKPFQVAARNLINEPIVQPPDGTAGNDIHPAWGLQWVEVEEVGPHWCFTVQGRGGAFGLAGGCQFAFAAATVDPKDVWWECTRMVGPDGRLGYQPIDEKPPPRPDRSTLVKALTALTCGQQRVLIEGGPAAAAAAIESLLLVLPVAVVQAHLWVTWLLKRPILMELPIVAGRWPQALSQAQAASLVDRWLTAPAPAPAVELSQRRTEAIEWLVDDALSGGRNARQYLAAHDDLPRLLDAIAMDVQSLRIEDVPELIQVGSARLSHGIGPQLACSWAGQQPEQAIAYLLRGGLPAWLADLLMEGLLQAHLQAAPGANPMYFPPAREPWGGWHDYLAHVLRNRFDRQQLIEFVRSQLVAPGRPLAGRESITRSKQWLQKLGLSPTDLDTAGIFPVPTESIVEELFRVGQISVNNRELLRNAADLDDELRRVIERMGTITPRAGGELLTCAAEVGWDVSALRQLALRLHQHNGGHGHNDWFGPALTNNRSTAGVKLVLLEAGVKFYEWLKVGQLPAPFLSGALHAYAGLPETHPSQNRIMLEAATQLAGQATNTGFAEPRSSRNDNPARRPAAERGERGPAWPNPSEHWDQPHPLGGQGAIPVGEPGTADIDAPGDDRSKLIGMAITALIFAVQFLLALLIVFAVLNRA